MYQRTIVVGHLGRDPEMRYLQDGTAVTSFSVATTRKWTRDGQPQEETTWFRISVFGKQAEPCNQYLSKGSLALVEGRVSVQTFQGKDGQTRASLELHADSVRFLGGKREAGEAKGDPVGPAVSVKDEEEIPF